MQRLSVSLLLAIVLALPLSASSLVVNGSFEDASLGSLLPTGDFETLDALSTSMAGWAVTSGSVDWIRAYWTAADGNFSLDMNGITAGTIEQTISGINPEASYLLTFSLAGNPDTTLPKTLYVSLGEESFQVTFDQNSWNRTNMGWTVVTHTFHPQSDGLVQSFSGDPNGQSWGPALDDVKLEAVPEPASPLLFVTLGALLSLSRRWLKKK